MAETELTYEQALDLFDQHLKALEDGNLTLEAALEAVDKMQVYLRVCQGRLEEAKRRIEVRPPGDGEAAPEQVPPPELDDPETLFR
jgi:exodeoxyribonuclease VII small subunit